MYRQFSQLCGRLLRIPADPEPPPGDESSTRRFRAAPNFLKYLLFLWGLKTLVLVVFVCWPTFLPWIVLTFVSQERHPAAGWFLAGFIVLFPLVAIVRLFMLGVVRLDYDKRWYLVTDRSLRVREGVLSIGEMTITFANIQNISISQGPIQRLLGIADLRLDTAGGGGHVRGQPQQSLHTAYFRGIDNAREVRELIQQRLRLWKDSGLGDHEELAAMHAAAVAFAPAPAPGEVIQALQAVLAEASALRRSAGRY